MLNNDCWIKNQGSFKFCWNLKLFCLLFASKKFSSASRQIIKIAINALSAFDCKWKKESNNEVLSSNRWTTTGWTTREGIRCVSKNCRYRVHYVRNLKLVLYSRIFTFLPTSFLKIFSGFFILSYLTLLCHASI